MLESSHAALRRHADTWISALRWVGRFTRHLTHALSTPPPLLRGIFKEIPMRAEPTRFSPNPTPCGHNRREFLWEVAGGFAGLALFDLLSRDGFFRQRVASFSLNQDARLCRIR